jgi:nitric oxide reductase NorQ protein
MRSAGEAEKFKHSACVTLDPAKNRRFSTCKNCGSRRLVWHACDHTLRNRRKWVLYESKSHYAAVIDLQRPHVCSTSSNIGPVQPVPANKEKQSIEDMLDRLARGEPALPPPPPVTTTPPVTGRYSSNPNILPTPSVKSSYPGGPLWDPQTNPVPVVGQKQEEVVPIHGYVPQGSEWEELLLSAKLRQPTLLQGPAGCGKTQLVDALAAELDRRVFCLQGGQGVLFEHVYGHYDLENGATVWKDGLVTEACRADDEAILYLDEPNALDDGIRYLLHGLLDHRRGITLYEHGNEEVVAPGLVVVASLNAGRDQGASASLSPPAGAFMSRFLKLNLDYLPPQRESALLAERTGVPIPTATAMVAVAQRVRKARTEKNASGVAPLARTVPCGTRTLLQWAERVAAGAAVRPAAMLCIVGLGGTPAEEQALKEVIDAVLPASMK